MFDDAHVRCICCIQVSDGRMTGIYANTELYASYVVTDVTLQG